MLSSSIHLLMNQAPRHKILCSSGISYRIPWSPAIRLGSMVNRTGAFLSQKNLSCLRKPSAGFSFLTRAEPTPSSTAMEPTAEDEVMVDVPTQFRIYKSGRIERLNLSHLPAGLDVATGVTSKDVVLDAGIGLSVRVYLPKLQDQPSNKKLPVLVYVHGGAFIIGSASDYTYHTYVNSLAAAAGVLVVSVDYRLAPEHPLPAAYEDAWAAFQWAASAQDEWIASHGDLGRLFLSGDSAGANIVHDMLMRASESGPRVEGTILCHPWFGGNEPIEGEPEGGSATFAGLWLYACPSAVGGADDPRFNPLAPGAPALEKLGCARMLVCAGKEDGLYARDRAYHDALAASAWPGTVEWHESDGEGHDFFLGKPECENAKRLMDCIVAFIAGEPELGSL